MQMNAHKLTYFYTVKDIWVAFFDLIFNIKKHETFYMYERTVYGIVLLKRKKLNHSLNLDNVHDFLIYKNNKKFIQ